jgi:hypothetical protein
MVSIRWRRNGKEERVGEEGGKGKRKERDICSVLQIYLCVV